MNIFKDFSIGVFSVLKSVGAPLLYRYPSRNSAEALRGDWLRIAGDIDAVIGQLKQDKRDER